MLEAERTLAQAESSLAQAEAELSDDLVQLFLAWRRVAAAGLGRDWKRPYAHPP